MLIAPVLRLCGFLILSFVAGCATTGRNVLPLPALITSVQASVVTLYDSSQSVGAGFFVHGDGLIVTNAHLVGRPGLVAQAADGSRHAIRVLRVDEELDIAICQIAASDFPALELRSSPATVGEAALAIGNPFGLGPTASLGIVSAEPRSIGKTYRLQTDASINPGNSGGPLVDRQGRVIGVVNARARLGQGVGFAVPAEYVQSLLEAERSLTGP